MLFVNKINSLKEDDVILEGESGISDEAYARQIVALRTVGVIFL